jgi:hypothetical protein
VRSRSLLARDDLADTFLSEDFFYSDPELRTDTSYMSHVEKYEEAIRKLVVVLRKVRDLTKQGQYGEEIYP